MRYVISGSRTITDEKWVEQQLRSYIACKDCVITGGAKGVDTIAHDYAFRMFCDTKVINADWDKHGRAAGPIRNGLMLNEGDVLIALWDGKSRGTKNCIEQAMRRKIETHIYFYDKT